MKFTERRPYVPIVKRPKLEWPNGAHLAVWVVPNIEHWEAEMLTGTTISSPAKEPPDVPNFNWREYGLRVGVFRTIDTLRRLDIKGTVALNSRVCDLYPEIMDTCLDLGWEFMGHGRTNSVGLSGMSEDDERALIPDVLATIERRTGKRPRGWLGPGLAETDRTLDLLAEAGVEYVSDWVSDDQPYPLASDHGTVIAMPYSLEMNDIGTFLRRGFTGPQYAEMLTDQFDVLYAESKRTAKVMCIATHPYITGVPFRAKHLEAALSYMRDKKRAWFATGSEILDAYRTAVGT
jgi:peptidoglycan/xylan/chitin deacetylase (PgdA/CDA1 family)